jgi:hypothetical protein
MNEKKLSAQQRDMLVWLWKETLRQESQPRNFPTHVSTWSWRRRQSTWVPSQRASFSRALRRLAARGLIRQFCFHKNLELTSFGREIAKWLTN